MNMATLGNLPKSAFLTEHDTASMSSSRLGEGVMRVFDVIIACAALVFLAPLMIIVAITIYVLDPGPIFFAHVRVGRNGRVFRCLKFRSMVVNAEERLRDLLRNDPAARAEWEKDHKLRNDPRVIGIGKFLRKSSIDELPQLFNVLRGEMSIVGPRPIVTAEVPRYGRYFQHYCSVRPGITGLWQISGRNDTSYRRRIAFDVIFCRTLSVKLYLRILFGTIPSVMMQQGSY
ncbi:sugar transferase [Novosphingobium sp. NBM11]|uniref:sugar transferase n=1 Tax=Novosphingobium sp. NBM11 TaxID=2596914 RepID=UPI0028165B03|nr:sugar transferase [Novosphingobium sp. NBM11]